MSARGIVELPCGCSYWIEGKKFVLDACKDSSCEYRKFIYEETLKMGHPVVELKV